MSEMCPTCEYEVESDQLTDCDCCHDPGCEKCMPNGLCNSCETQEREAAEAENFNWPDDFLDEDGD